MALFADSIVIGAKPEICKSPFEDIQDTLKEAYLS